MFECRKICGHTWPRCTREKDQSGSWYASPVITGISSACSAEEILEARGAHIQCASGATEEAPLLLGPAKQIPVKIHSLRFSWQDWKLLPRIWKVLVQHCNDWSPSAPGAGSWSGKLAPLLWWQLKNPSSVQSPSGWRWSSTAITPLVFPATILASVRCQGLCKLLVLLCTTQPWSNHDFVHSFAARKASMDSVTSGFSSTSEMTETSTTE